jgi:hypothetical protein
MLLWHQQYVACCIELNQWDTIVEYAKVTDQCPLQIDAMVHSHDWQNLKTVRHHHPCPSLCAACLLLSRCCASTVQMVLPKAQVEENADATIVRAQLHLQELQVVDVDRICKQVGAEGDSRFKGLPCCAF